ncbi:MAG: NAD-dependent epimerase/dehydratase family protein [Pseudomonadota bacterium]
MTRLRTAVVSGATGFVGGVLVRRLLARGTAVVCLVRARSYAPERHAGLAGADVVALDTFAPRTLAAALSGHLSEAVFNLAAYGVNPRDRDERELRAGNADLLLALIEASARWPLRRFVHAGSCSEYATARPGTLVAEDAPLVLPDESGYGGAKAAATREGTARARALGLPFVVARPFLTYGPSEAPHRLMSALARQLRCGEPVALSPGEQVRDFVFVDDVATVLEALATSASVADYEAYNVCTGRATTVRAAATLVALRLGAPAELLKFGALPYRAEDPPWLVGDNRRIAAATGWRPRIGLEEGIDRVIEAARVTAPTAP